METKNLATRYGLPALDWGAIRRDLDAGAIRVADGPGRVTCWLTSVDDDAAPHTNGIGAVWYDGAFWFVTGRTTRRGRNLARDPRCTLSFSTKEFDLVIEGEAEIVEDRATLEVLAALWRDEGWPCEVDESRTALTAPFSAPSAGGPPWHVFRIKAHSANVVTAREPGGATTWTFDS
ncbi:MAG: pyridoxamine 5'-phosphate oxidase family protein [Acidimicrobiia bacterium]